MKQFRGFTLIEMIIVVAVIGILSAIAMPMYRDYVIRANRSDAKVALAAVALAQERYYSVNSRYSSSLASLGVGTMMGVNNSGLSANGFYVIAVTAANPTASYLLSATPQTKSGQNNDKCSVLTLDSSGAKGVSTTYSGYGVDNCW